MADPNHTLDSRRIARDEQRSLLTNVLQPSLILSLSVTRTLFDTGAALVRAYADSIEAFTRGLEKSCEDVFNIQHQQK